MRSPWLPRLALGALGIALLYAMISIAVGEGGPDEVRIAGAGQTQQLIGGIAEEDAYLGNADARVTITVFNDLQAPSGADYQLGTIDPLIEEYVRTGQVRMELRHYSFTSRPTNLAAYAAVAAAEQGREWQYADLFFRNQDRAPNGRVTDEFLRDIANAVPELDASAWQDALDSQAVRDVVEADGQEATDRRLPATPAVVVEGPGGEEQLGDAPAADEIKAAIASVE